MLYVEGRGNSVNMRYFIHAIVPRQTEFVVLIKKSRLQSAIEIRRRYNLFEQSSSSKLVCDDDNLQQLREKYPKGLTFVVGDVHGEHETLKILLEKIRFDPEIDHVFFVGDYSAGGNPRALLEMLSEYFQADYDVPGFHMIRGNHERELYPLYYLENLPDIMVIKRKWLRYYISHAGMVSDVFDLINDDIQHSSEKNVFAYRLDDTAVAYDAPFRQVIWSRRGLYSQRSRWRLWPSEGKLIETQSCIIHGHTPYSFFFKEGGLGYGDRNLFWKNQHIWFSEDLQSFDIDSDIKGRNAFGETYRGLSCICLEALEEIVEESNGYLTVDGIEKGQNFVFSAAYCPNRSLSYDGDIHVITDSMPQMKMITIDGNGKGKIV